MRHHGQEGFDVVENNLRTAQSFPDLAGGQAGPHGFFFLGMVAMHSAKERFPALVVKIGAEFLTGGIIDDQEIQVDAVILVICQLKIEEFVSRIFPIPGSDLYLIAPVLGIQFYLG